MAPTTLSIGTAANRIIGTLRKEAQAAAGNDVLTATEQKKLSPWAASTAAALRKEEGRVTVDGFVDAIAPKVRRALAAISDDGKNVTRKDIADVRVDDLRSRVATLFGVSDGPTGSMNALTKAVDAAAKDNDFGNMGNWFALSTDHKTENEILAEVANMDVIDLVSTDDSYFDKATGKQAVSYFIETLRDHASQFADDDNATFAAHINAVADEVEGAFLPTSQWKKIIYASHAIQEDGDIDARVLMAQKKNNDWVNLSYVNYPF